MGLKKEEDNGGSETPGWMVTMSDMNMLLLTFFVMLISMMTLEKPKLERLTEILHIAGRRFRPTEGKTTIPAINKIRESRKASEADFSTTEVLNLKGTKVEVSKTSSGIKYSFGSSDLAFSEGEWRLTESQKTVLNELSRIIYGVTNIIYIHGYCDLSGMDAVYFDGNSVIPLNKYGGTEVKGDKEMLSLLRATSVQKFLSNPKRDNYIREDKIIPVGLADSAPLVENPVTDEDRASNRRFELVVTEDK